MELFLNDNMDKMRLKEIAKQELFDPSLQYVKLGNSKHIYDMKIAYFVSINRIFDIYSAMFREVSQGNPFPIECDYSLGSVFSAFEQLTYDASLRILDKEWEKTDYAVERIYALFDKLSSKVTDGRKKIKLLVTTQHLEELITHKLVPINKTKEGDVYLMMHDVIYTLTHEINEDDFTPNEYNMLSTGVVDVKKLYRNILVANAMCVVNGIKGGESVISLLLPLKRYKDEVRIGNLWELDELYDIEEEEEYVLDLPEEILNIKTFEEALDYLKNKAKELSN